MKKLCMGLLMIGMTSLGYAQYSQTNTSIANGSIDFLFVNPDYLDDVRSSVTPNYAKYLEGIVASWDATESTKFDGREAPFKVTFKSQRGYINVAFDSKGKIASATEKFSNVALPRHVLKTVAKKYPQWYTVKNSYTVKYKRGHEISKTLKIQLQKDGVKKNLKMADSANLF